MRPDLPFAFVFREQFNWLRVENFGQNLQYQSLENSGGNKRLLIETHNQPTFYSFFEVTLHRTHIATA